MVTVRARSRSSRDIVPCGHARGEGSPPRRTPLPFPLSSFHRRRRQRRRPTSSVVVVLVAGRIGVRRHAWPRWRGTCLDRHEQRGVRCTPPPTTTTSRRHYCIQRHRPSRPVVVIVLIEVRDDNDPARHHHGLFSFPLLGAFMTSSHSPLSSSSSVSTRSTHSAPSPHTILTPSH